MFLFSTVSLLAIMGMIFNHNFSSNEIGFYNEGTQVQAKFAHVQDLSDVEKGELEDRVEISITSITTSTKFNFSFNCLWAFAICPGYQCICCCIIFPYFAKNYALNV